MARSAALNVPANRWQSMAFDLDEGAPHKAAIGVITLANDLTIEPELVRFFPDDGVALYANRIPFPPSATVETLASMENDITATAALINPGCRLDVVIFGCTSGTMTIGDDVVRERILAGKPDVQTTDPITAGITGLKKLGCKSIALLTPYIDEVNQVVERFVTGKGMHVARCGSFGRESAEEMCQIAPQSIFDAGLVLASHDDVDGLFISCTALRVSPIIEKLEQALGKPVVSSNQALAWHSMRLAGYDEPVSGYGRLLRS